jgi:glyoxylase-like metal-dependent hydrolase (beta-lactamase superfamily II)
MNRRQFLSLASILVPVRRSAGLGSSLEVISGPVNGVIVTQRGRKLAIYGDPRPTPAVVDQVLLTHSRRDVCWAACGLQQHGATVTAPKLEAGLLVSPEAFWKEFLQTRFHDYAMINTKVLARSLPVHRTVGGGDLVRWQDLVIEVLDTPGYSRGAVSYLFTVDGKRIACVGDLIYGAGQLLDLYSLQDAVPEAKLRGYHGYAARGHELINSLRQVAARGPDVLIPARGPLIDQPVAAIERLIERVKVVLREHFKTDALRWYFGDDNLRLRARKLLEGDVPTWMPMAIQRELPPWLLVIGNSRLLVSDTGSAFLVDCGFDTVIEELKRLRAQGRYQALEGIFITHYHDDHTDRAELCAEQFQCPIYFSPELKEVLENPRAYRMPCLSPYPIRRGKPMSQGAVLHWHEFELMFSYFPGQTLLHDSLLVKRTGGETVLFVGDSFTPSGLDDYCLWNRNFLASRSGFLRCLEDLQKLPPDHLLVNQHVEPAFRFSSEQLAFMIQSLQRRAEAMEQLFPWPNVNYGIDEQWVRLMPYECSTTPGKPFEIRSVIWNHLLKEQEYRVRPVLPEGWSSDQNEYQLRVPAQSEGAVSMRITPGTHSQDLAIILVDVDFGSWQLRQWSEAIVKLI